MPIFLFLLGAAAGIGGTLFAQASFPPTRYLAFFIKSDGIPFGGFFDTQEDALDFARTVPSGGEDVVVARVEGDRLVEEVPTVVLRRGERAGEAIPALLEFSAEEVI